jgi:pyruvyl transferase EpsO
MAFLKKGLNQISQIKAQGTGVAYLDYPVYSNIGDILIMKGTERFFAEHKINVKSRYSLVDYSSKIEFPEDIVLTFQGGGNFGDLYPEFQRFRESFIRKYKKNKIIILPQTIYYRNPEALERSSEILSNHPDLHIFVRDKRSFKIAKKYFSDFVYLAPDMATPYGPFKRP